MQPYTKEYSSHSTIDVNPAVFPELEQSVEKDQLRNLLGSPIAYYTPFAIIGGSVEAGIFVSQFFYWYGKGHHPDGWIYKTQEEILRETGLSRRNQETARRHLRELGILEECLMGLPATMHYRLNLDHLYNLMGDRGMNPMPQLLKMVETESASFAESAPQNEDVQSVQSTMAEPANPVCTNPPNKYGGSVQTSMADSANPSIYTENTSENSSKSTTDRRKDSALITDSATIDESVVVVVESSPTPNQLPDLALPEQQESFNHILHRFTELTDNHQPNARDTILLRKLSGYAKNIIDNAFDAALERATNPDKPLIRDAAAWLLGTAKRMKEQMGSQVKPRTQEPTSEDYRRFNRENGGVLLGLSGSVEEGGSVEEVKIETKVEEKQVEPIREEPTEEQKEAWTEAQREVKGTINAITYNMAIEPLVLVAVEGNQYTLQAPNQGVITFLEQNGIGFVKRVFRTCLADPTAVISFEAAEQPKRNGSVGRRFH